MNESNSLTRLFDEAGASKGQDAVDALRTNSWQFDPAFDNGYDPVCFQARSKSAADSTTAPNTTASPSHHTSKKRPAPSSAPSSRSSKYDELSPWAFSFAQASERFMATQKSKQLAANRKGASSPSGGGGGGSVKTRTTLPSFYTSQKFRNSKLQQRCSWLPTESAAFQHHIDLNKYMSEYRGEKLTRMKEEISRDEAVITAENAKHSEELLLFALQRMGNRDLNQNQASKLREKTELLQTLQKLNKFELPTTRSEMNEQAKIDPAQASSSQKIVRAVLKDSPMKIRGGKVYQERATYTDEKPRRKQPPTFQMSHSTTHFNPLTNRYEPSFPLTTTTAPTATQTTASDPSSCTSALRRFDAVATTTTTVPRKSFLSDDILLCRKLTEPQADGCTMHNNKYSRSPVPNGGTGAMKQWKSPVNVKKSQTGRVAHGLTRQAPALQASGIRYSDYDQIIKRLVDQNGLTNQASSTATAMPATKPLRIRSSIRAGGAGGGGESMQPS